MSILLVVLQVHPYKGTFVGIRLSGGELDKRVNAIVSELNEDLKVCSNKLVRWPDKVEDVYPLHLTLYNGQTSPTGQQLVQMIAQLADVGKNLQPMLSETKKLGYFVTGIHHPIYIDISDNKELNLLGQNIASTLWPIVGSPTYPFQAHVSIAKYYNTNTKPWSTVLLSEHQQQSLKNYRAYPAFPIKIDHFYLEVDGKPIATFNFGSATPTIKSTQLNKAYSQFQKQQVASVKKSTVHESQVGSTSAGAYAELQKIQQLFTEASDQLNDVRKRIKNLQRNFGDSFKQPQHQQLISNLVMDVPFIESDLEDLNKYLGKYLIT